MGNIITAEELFYRVEEILTRTDLDGAARNKMMHDTLVLCCHTGIKDTQQSYGNLFSQVDYLCKVHHIGAGDNMAIQTMRRHSNSEVALPSKEMKYDLRALCLLISAVFSVDIPSNIVSLIPSENRPYTSQLDINNRYIRCIVQQFDEDFIFVNMDAEYADMAFRVYLRNDELAIDHSYLTDIIHKGMQLNLLDNHVDKASNTITARIIVVEPDYLIDISAIAACFLECGHHPLLYIVNQMKPRANSQATLLGNFAGSALDDIINCQEHYDPRNTLKTNFKEKALEFCTCTGFDAQKFKEDAYNQCYNLGQVVRVLFGKMPGRERLYDKGKAILEPSFICEALGIQGRVDLMTTDYKLLVEQKSGRNINVERRQADPRYRSFQLENHYVQLLLYYGVLHYNFHLGKEKVDIRLLYSKYPPRDGLMVVAYYQKLFREAIKFRNQLVAENIGMARDGFETRVNELYPRFLNVTNSDNYFFNRFLAPQISEITDPIHQLSPLEESYFCRMMTFVLREELISKLGAQEGTSNSQSDLWNLPLAEKKDTGSIYTGLKMMKKEQSSDFNGYDTLTFSIPDQGEDFLPNFRVGDMVYLYAYANQATPDVRNAILFKGVLQKIHTERIVVHLNNGQQNPDIITGDNFAIEHASSDASAGGAIRSLHQLICSELSKRQLLLGQREPKKDESLTLSRSYDNILDPILLRAKQAQDYFLLIGPPGTGKTSRALQFMVREALSTPDRNILLMSYTNRAVDEICEMLCDNDIPFLRISNEYSCDERFRPYLLEKSIEQSPKLADIRNTLIGTRVIVGTTSFMAAKPFIFNLKHFDLAIIDESSQILEPNLIGLLTLVNKFILIGDYKQLPAVVQQSEQESKVDDKLLHDICLDNCRNSLFERLIRWEEKNRRNEFIGILRRQGRMHPDIAEFPNEMFYFRENLEPVPCPHQLDQSISHRMIFIPSEFCKQPNISDKINISEAKIVARCLKKIYQEYKDDWDATKTVGVIVPYRNQIAMIRKEIEKLDIADLQKISIDTVERYQGSQRDVIIYSFTIQNNYQLEFLTSNCFREGERIIDRKLNVAITRARKQMIMTGNVQILSRNLIFRELINFCKEKKGFIEQF